MKKVLARYTFMFIWVLLGLTLGFIIHAIATERAIKDGESGAYPESVALAFSVDLTETPEIFICPNGGGGLCTWCGSDAGYCRVVEIHTPTSPPPVIGDAVEIGPPGKPLPSPTRRPPLPEPTRRPPWSRKVLESGWHKIIKGLTTGSG